MANSLTRYPGGIDTFPEVVNGQGPDSLITADLINKVQQAVVALEGETQYNAITGNASGSLLWYVRKYHRVQEDASDPNSRLVVRISLDRSIAQQFFGGNPFSASYGIMAYANAWGQRDGRRVHFVCRAGVNTLAGDNSLTLAVVLHKYNAWKAGDQVEITLVMARP